MKTENQMEHNFMETMNKLAEWMQQSKMYVLNLEKEGKVYEVQQKMQEILDEENIKSKVEICPCPLGMGDVIIKFEIEEFIVRNTKKFMDAVKEMDNFEIYPTKKGIKFAGVISRVANISAYKEEK